MSSEDKVVTWQQLGEHTTPNNCWILVDGIVYAVSDFIVEHPGGDEPLLKNAGLDATEAFNNIGHSEYAVSLRNARQIGMIQKAPCPQGYVEKIKAKKAEHDKAVKMQFEAKRHQNLVHQSEHSNGIPTEIVNRHNSEEDCWLIIDGKVVDVGSYINEHPGGVSVIMAHAGKDGSKAFHEAGHSLEAIGKKDSKIIGPVEPKSNMGLIAIILILVALVGGFFFLLKSQ